MRWMSEVQGGEGEEKGGKASQELYWSRFFSPPFRWGKKGLALFLEKEAVAVYVQYTKKTLLLCGKVEAEANPVSFRFFIFYSGRRGKRLLFLRRRRPLKMTILPILPPFSLHWRRFRPILLLPFPLSRPPTQPGVVRRGGKERKEAIFPESSLCSVRWENLPKYNMSAVTNALLFKTCTVWPRNFCLLVWRKSNLAGPRNHGEKGGISRLFHRPREKGGSEGSGKSRVG